MKTLRNALIASTLFWVVYLVSVLLPAHPAWVLGLFSLTPVVVVMLVWKVLRDGTPSPYTFEERFYEDWAYRPVSASTED